MIDFADLRSRVMPRTIYVPGHITSSAPFAAEALIALAAEFEKANGPLPVALEAAAFDPIYPAKLNAFDLTPPSEWNCRCAISLDWLYGYTTRRGRVTKRHRRLCMRGHVRGTTRETCRRCRGQVR